MGQSGAGWRLAVLVYAGRYVLSQFAPSLGDLESAQALDSGPRARRAKLAAASFGFTIFTERLPSVLGTASARQVHPAVVRRNARRLDHLHAVFPGGPAGRLQYAHLISSRSQPRTQGPLHASLIFVCVLLLVGLTMAWGSPL